MEPVRLGSSIREVPPEVMDNVLEHVDSLGDLGSLSFTNRTMAGLVGSMRAKTLWRITMRSGDYCTKYCTLHDGDGGRCWCGLMNHALGEARSRPFRVRAWLYRRASRGVFGHSEESLEGCQVPIRDFNPYHAETEGPCLGHEDDDDYREVREWNLIWMSFIRYLTMQRVQRVNTGDEKARPQWRRGYWERLESAIALMSPEHRVPAMECVRRLTWRDTLERTEVWGQEFS